MGHDQPARGVLAQGVQHELVGEAVKAVLANTLLVELGRQREPASDLGHARVKAGVEAGHLRQAGPLGVHGLDDPQGDGHVQRRPGDVLLQVAHDAGVISRGP